MCLGLDIFVFNLTMTLLISVQFSSVAQSCPALCNPMNRSTPGLPVHHQLPEFTPTHVHWVSDDIQLSHPLLSPSPPALSLAQHQGFFNWVSSSHQVAKVLEFSFNISPTSEHPGLISFRMDWLDLLAVQRTLKSLLQHHSSKASILQRSTFFKVQLSHPYMTTGKTIALTRRALIMSLLFNMLSRLVITILPKSWVSFNFMAAVTICSDSGAQKKSQPLFALFPHLFAMKWWDRMPWSLFSVCESVCFFSKFICIIF